MKELKLADVKDFGNAEFVETININGICVGDHCAADYPQAKWESTAETADGKKIIITYITTPEDAKIAKSHGLDAIDWNSKITKITKIEEEKYK